MDVLYAHLHRSMAEPFVWGESDCMLDPANYLLLLTGHDCGQRFRGLYDDRASCHRLTGYLRDPVAPAAACLSEFGLAIADEAQRGDVGVIRVVDSGKVQACGAICTGRHWAVKALTGLAIGPALEVLAAWRVPPDLKAPDA